MLLQAIIPALLAIVVEASPKDRYHAFNCSTGPVEVVGNRAAFFNSSRVVAQWLLQENVYKYIDEETGYFNGTLAALRHGYVYHHHCRKIMVNHIFDDDECFHGHTSRATTDKGEIVHVANDHIIVKNPAKAKCYTTMGEQNVLRELETTHAAYAFAQARNEIPLEDLSVIFNLESALDNIEVLLDTGADRNETTPVDVVVHRFYKKWVSKWLAFYAIIYAVYTTALTITALWFRIPLIRSLRVLFASVRRLGDLLSYRRDQVMQQQAQRLREARSEQGLADPMPIFDYTLSHFQNIYRAIISINERLEAINERLNALAPPQAQVQTNSSGSNTPTPRQARARRTEARTYRPQTSSRQYRRNQGRPREGDQLPHTNNGRWERPSWRTAP